ncbi:hypothetical protein [Streptomyces sp. NPDC054838]
MNIRTEAGRHEGPAPSRNKYSPSVQTLGYLLGTVWFAFLALSGDERPGWLRAVYAVVAVTFAFGVAATIVNHLRERRCGGSSLR